MVARGLGLSARRSGLGEDPSSPCYDPTRPWWWPNVINTSNETACINRAQSSVTFAQAVNQAFNPSVIPPLTTMPTLGLPVGYDPASGLVDPSNVAGATVTPDYAATVRAYLQSQTAGPPGTPGDGTGGGGGGGTGGGTAACALGTDQVAMFICQNWPVLLGAVLLLMVLGSGGGRR
jgi:hypothetical protein